MQEEPTQPTNTVIQSYNSMQLRKFNTQTNVSDRVAVIIVAVLIGLGILFGARLAGMDLSNSKVTNAFKKNGNAVDPTTGAPLAGGGATTQLADLNDTAAADAAAAASGAGSTTTGGTGNTSSKKNGKTSSKSATGGTTKTTTPAPAAAPPAPAASACGNASIPAEACTSLLSIESAGPKTSPYMLVDVSILPDGASVVFDKNSWQDIGDGSAKISFIITALGQQQPGWLTLTNENGTWNATDYE